MSTRRTARGPSPRRSGQRRRTAWFRHLSLDTALSANGIVVATLVDSSVNVLLTDSTVTRMIFNVNPTQIEGSGGNAGQNVLIGIVIANETAVAAGAASLPDPASSGGVDWLFYGGFVVPAISLSQPAEDLVFRHLAVARDIRSQRKLNENNSDVVMLVSEESGITCDVSIVANTLIRLP